MRDHDHNTKLLEGIEACRPGSDDFDLPEMSDVARRLAEDAEARDLYERVQQSDAAVASVFRGGSVPVGLEDRLLAALYPETSDGEAASVIDNAEIDTPAKVERPLPAPATSRRAALWMLATSAAVLVAAGFGVFYLLGSGEPLTVQNVLSGTTASLDAVSDGAWQSVASAPPSHPASGRLKIAPTDWQQVRAMNDSRAVAYRFGDRSAMLLVFRPRAKVADLPAAPPPTPQDVVSGLVRATWVEGGLVYVLTLEGGGACHDYQRFVDVPGLALLNRPQSLPNRHNG